MTNLYQSDVRSLSDEELRVLSEELSDEYQNVYDDDGYAHWTDDAAERRYWDIHFEMRRRWEVAHPDWKPIPPSEFMKIVLGTLASSLASAKSMSREYGHLFEAKANKIGDTLSVHKPARYTGGY